jgi:quercetin dioxygenase-like cupin family protein
MTTGAAASGLLVVGPGEGPRVDLGGLGVDFKLWGEATGGALSVVEHPMQPRRLVPPHVHANEDELSYVLEGTFGVRIGDQESEAGPGTYIYKPKGIPHTFWNPTDSPARMIELIFPAGFEHFFEALGPINASPGSSEDLRRQREELGERYNLGFDPEWVEDLKSRYGLKLLGEP